MSKYRRIAAVVARRSFAHTGVLEAESGAELTVLVEEFAETEDAEWLLEEGESERRLVMFQKAMEWVLDSYVSRHMTPPLEATDAVTFFRFAVRDDPSEEVRVRDLRGRLRLHDAMLAILRALDPDDFELLCGRVLVEVGCDKVYVTRSSQDLGSDFFGRSPAAEAVAKSPGVPTRRRVLGDVYMLLFGQAKRYADYNTINLDTVKLVEGTWNDIVRRRQDGALPSHLDDGLAEIGWQAGDRVTLMFITTSSYTRPARVYAAHAGMATLDGDQLSQLLLEAAVGVERAQPDGPWSTDVDVVKAACAV